MKLLHTLFRTHLLSITEHSKSNTNLVWAWPASGDSFCYVTGIYSIETVKVCYTCIVFLQASTRFQDVLENWTDSAAQASLDTRRKRMIVIAPLPSDRDISQ